MVLIVSFYFVKAKHYQDLVPKCHQPGIKPVHSALAAWSLNHHWTTRGVPLMAFNSVQIIVSALVLSHLSFKEA